MLDKAVILSDSFADDIKSVIVSTAESKVNEVKTQVIAQLDVLSGDCARRNLGDLAELELDGSQRILTNGLTFANLAASFQATDGVVSLVFLSALLNFSCGKFFLWNIDYSKLTCFHLACCVMIQTLSATAGFHPGRKEISVDVSLHMEQVFDKTYFIHAFNASFADLGPAQAMFGAASESPIISELIDATSSLVAFDISFSTGIKVENALSVFSGGAAEDATASLFFRLDDIGVFAEATVDQVNLNLFPGVTIENGSFLLSAGVRLATPFEGEVTVDGSLAIGLSFSQSLNAIKFLPHGQLTASLPFQATLNDVTQTLTIKFEDSNLFDDKKPLIKVDFPVCPAISIVDGLLGKLGSLELSPRRILGFIETAGLNIADTLDDYFPDVAQYLDGILEGTC